MISNEPSKPVEDFAVDRDWDIEGETQLPTNYQSNEQIEAHEVWLKLVDAINDILDNDDIDIMKISQYKD